MAVQEETVLPTEWAELKERVQRLEQQWEELKASAIDNPSVDQREQRLQHHPLAAVAGAFEGDPLWEEFEVEVREYRRSIDSD
jgi:hypothetical protein